MLDGDTVETTSEPNIAEQVQSAFAALREAGPEVEQDVQAEAAETDAPVASEPAATETEVETAKERIRFKIGDEEVDEDTVLEWKKSGLRQQDYTQKRMADSQKMRELEQERVTEREQTLQKWQALEDAVASATPKEPDWAALQAQVRAGSLPEGDYNRFAADWLAQKTQREAIQAERQKAEDAVKADRQKAAEVKAKENYGLVLTIIPEWKDEGVRQKDFTGMVEYMKSIAPDLEESALMGAHPALFKALRDAHLYQKLQQSTTKPKVVKIDAALKPGSTNAPAKPSGTDTALRRVAQTHSDADAVVAFRELRKQGLYKS